MSKTYDRAPASVKQRGDALIRRFHRELTVAEVSIDYLFVSTDGDGPALTLHGTAAYAVVKISSSKDRAKGMADAEILIDRNRYEMMTDKQKDALLDHELYHLLVQKEDDGGFKVDDQQRPRLRMRPHDHEFGWFVEIARRHQEHSIEVQQAARMHMQAGQVYFPFMEGAALT
jgi:hypothetical protein